MRRYMDSSMINLWVFVSSVGYLLGGGTGVAIGLTLASGFILTAEWIAAGKGR
jgi:hypothetical protein